MAQDLAPPAAPGTSDLVDRVAIVTGAGQGIGAACARALAARGARVVVADVREDLAEREAQHIGSAASAHVLDVGDEAMWESMVEGTVAAFGAVHVLVNNAGISRRAPVHELSTHAFDETLRVNLYGTFFGIRSVAGPMGDVGGGSIINVSSMAAIRAFAAGGAYAASKWGIRGLSRVAAVDLAPLGIRVNTVLPGAIDTPMLHDLARGARAGGSGGSAAVQPRVGTPQEVANVVTFLASDAAAYVTGAEYVVDGGRSL